MRPGILSGVLDVHTASIVSKMVELPPSLVDDGVIFFISRKTLDGWWLSAFGVGCTYGCLIACSSEANGTMDQSREEVFIFALLASLTVELSTYQFDPPTHIFWSIQMWLHRTRIWWSSTMRSCTSRALSLQLGSHQYQPNSGPMYDSQLTSTVA
jgi:hypothetical protein